MKKSQWLLWTSSFIEVIILSKMLYGFLSKVASCSNGWGLSLWLFLF